MILTIKIKHNENFDSELSKAFQIAQFSIQNKGVITSKAVSHFGLKSMISNQILRKYGRNKKCKNVKSVNLCIPNQGIKYLKETKTIYIACLKKYIDFSDCRYKFQKINQIEINKSYYYVSIEIEPNKEIETQNIMGIDLNATGHTVVGVISNINKVIKLGKKESHVRKKYKDIRKKLQKKQKYNHLKKIKNREKNIVKDINHKCSRHIVNEALKYKCEIKLENLTNIRKNTNKKNKYQKQTRGIVNSWSFYQFQNFLKYKALLAGIRISYVDPHNTSSHCSKCGHEGFRD